MFDPQTLLIGLDRDLCLSGGAIGADLQWGMTAGSAGYMVIHWSFDGHNTYAPEVEVVRLTQDQLNVADPALHRANNTIGRKVPLDKPCLCNLLRRSYYQVKWSNAVYAVGKFKSGMVDGGTSWAVQMYMDRFLHDCENLENCNLYFFDQVSNSWFTWKGSWQKLEGQPPKPSGVWAGIGSRDLTSEGKQAIRTLMGWQTPAQT